MHRICIISVLVFFCSSILSYSKDSNLKGELLEKRTELTRVNKKIKEKKRKFKSLTQKEISVISEMNHTEQRLAERNMELESLDSQVEKLSENKACLSDEIIRAQKDIRALGSRLYAYLVRIYKFDRSRHTKTLLPWHSQSNLLQSYALMGIVLNARLAQMDEYQQRLSALKEKEEEQERGGEKLAILRADLERSKFALSMVLESKREKLTAIKKGKRLSMGKMRELERHSKGLQLMIDELGRQKKRDIGRKESGDVTYGFQALMGKLDPPVSGKILPMPQTVPETSGSVRAGSEYHVVDVESPGTCRLRGRGAAPRLVARRPADRRGCPQRSASTGRGGASVRRGH